jgi:hypothetical protein
MGAVKSIRLGNESPASWEPLNQLEGHDLENKEKELLELV